MNEQEHPIRDAGLLRKVGDVIAAEPERYDQTYWAEKRDTCGTTACLAGWAVQVQPDFEGFDFDGSDDALADRCIVGGEVVQIEATARRLLGLEDNESEHLFRGGWRPAGEGPLHERVRDALYALADGASVEDVSA